MKERPMIFGGFSVRAMLADPPRKTQTRRVIKPQPEHCPDLAALGGTGPWWPCDAVRAMVDLGDPQMMALCPHGYGSHRPKVLRDRIWVKETWRAVERSSDGVDGILYRADDAFIPIEPTIEAADRWGDANANGKYGTAWRSPIFMRRWMVRLILEITNVRAQRLQDISEKDALAEGGWTYDSCPVHKDPIASFAVLWDEVNAHRGHPWEANDWVWAITFRRLSP